MVGLKYVRLNVTIEGGTKKRMKEEAAKIDMTMGEYVEIALTAYLEKRPGRRGLRGMVRQYEDIEEEVTY